MKISIVAPITLSLLAITLAGCGEGEDGIFGSGSSSNEFTVSSFDQDSNAIARIDTKYRKG
jgi:phosphoribosylformylglycinamidine (FGAM) synthase-like enzyme